MLRKTAAFVTDLSPIVASLAMDFFEQLFNRIPEAPELEEEARIWMPSLPMVNIIVDALMCRLADAKVCPCRLRCDDSLVCDRWCLVMM